MGQVRRLGDTKRGTVAAASNITDYEDFVICAERTDARTVSVTIDASPVGRMAKAQKVSNACVKAHSTRRPRVSELQFAVRHRDEIVAGHHEPDIRLLRTL